MFNELILKNRSCRGYDETRQVTREELLEMVDCARITASTMNVQPLKYSLSCEPEQVRRVLRCAKFGAALPDRTLPEPGKNPTAYIVICQDTAIHSNTNLFRIDVGIAAQTILLKATEMGLGGCMMASFRPETLQEQLQLPEGVIPVLLLAIGKPDEQVVLTEAEAGGSTKYYRDAQDVHYVPKRSLKDILL